MTVANRQKIQALSLEGAESAVTEDALAKWDARIRAKAAPADQHVISIYETIGQDFWTGGGVTTKSIAEELKNAGGKDVLVNINSFGGDYFDGVGIYNLLVDYKSKVTVQVVGIAASAASIIAMAGDVIRIAENGVLMIHNAWTRASGDRHFLTKVAADLALFDAALAGLYAAVAGVTKSEAAAWLDAETYFDGQGAIDAGLAHELMNANEVAADAPAAKAHVATRRVEAALARQGFSRNERRSLIGEIIGDPAVAGRQEDRPAVAGGEELMAAMARLEQSLTRD